MQFFVYRSGRMVLYAPKLGFQELNEGLKEGEGSREIGGMGR
jgi:hypothetical protein